MCAEYVPVDAVRRRPWVARGPASGRSEVRASRQTFSTRTEWPARSWFMSSVSAADVGCAVVALRCRTAGSRRGTRERHLSARLSGGDDEASVAAPAAVLSGAAHVVRDGTFPAEWHARTCARRFGTRGGRASKPLGGSERCSSFADMSSRCASDRSQPPMDMAPHALPHRRRRRAGGLHGRTAAGRVRRGRDALPVACGFVGRADGRGCTRSFRC
jgi:hypothetical protein